MICVKPNAVRFCAPVFLVCLIKQTAVVRPIQTNKFEIVLGISKSKQNVR